MKTIAYIRVSKASQSIKSQKLAILDYAHKNKLTIDKFMQFTISSRKNSKERGIDALFKKLKPKDTLIVSELSRLGRSVGQVLQTVDKLVQNKINLIAIKEDIQIKKGKRNIQTKVMITMIGLFAEIERDLISERTKEGLAAARKKGKLLGRPKGTFNSRIDPRIDEVKDLIKLNVSVASIAKIMGMSFTAMQSFIKKRKLK
jgi:DNA invertase Pin-like site-specific DNA recombinase